jgi:hypothetical protein
VGTRNVLGKKRGFDDLTHAIWHLKVVCNALYVDPKEVEEVD